jgi:hypothetical protein
MDLYLIESVEVFALCAACGADTSIIVALVVCDYGAKGVSVAVLESVRETVSRRWWWWFTGRGLCGFTY